MSKENVEILRTWAAALEARTPGKGPLVSRHTGEAVVAQLDPDVVYEDTIWPDHAAETYRGIDAVVRATERWTESYERLTLELERIVGTGDCLVSVHRLQAKARQTGIEFDEPHAILWRFRGGKVIYFRSFRDPDEAVEVAGLSE